ncbi:hypothetical protein [Xylophilus sp. GOD-11R]|uniref:AfsR/SARP family transcriptional regulator n=1 Tax=Xylophilus sp. GOD-11R TaxID=3089814 RepID=UPI00298C8EC8|nr:hypothetical protein [Xylophilus sp. GOD-11R]WPB57926.1 hypothetical protein R9X41_04580 [Xylophilus sp. GOD-11R]
MQGESGQKWERRSSIAARRLNVDDMLAPRDHQAIDEGASHREAELSLAFGDANVDEGFSMQPLPLLGSDAGEHLRIRTFGGLQVIGADGRPVGSLRGRQLQLLRWLVLARWGSPLGVAAVIDAMWPEAEGAAASSNFASTVRRLRGTLGNAAAIRVSAGRLSLVPTYCRVDLDDFQPLDVFFRGSNGAGNSEEASRLANRWLLLFDEENPVLNAPPDTPDMASRIRSVGIAWRHATLRLCQLLRGTPEAEKALRLCEAIERHGFADTRVMAEWHSLTVRGDPGRRKAERRSG